MGTSRSKRKDEDPSIRENCKKILHLKLQEAYLLLNVRSAPPMPYATCKAQEEFHSLKNPTHMTANPTQTHPASSSPSSHFVSDQIAVSTVDQ